MPDQYPQYGDRSFSAEDSGGQYCSYITEEPCSSDDEDQPFFEGDTMNHYQHQSPPHYEGGPSFTGVDRRQHSENNAVIVNFGAGEPSQYPDDVRMNWFTPAPGCNPSFSRRAIEEVGPTQGEPVQDEPQEDFYPSIDTETNQRNAGRVLESGREVQTPPNHEHYHDVEAPEPAQSNKSSRRPKHYNSKLIWDDKLSSRLRELKDDGKDWKVIGAELGIGVKKCISRYNNMRHKEEGKALAWQPLDLGQSPMAPGQIHVSSQVHQDAAGGNFLPTAEDSPYVFYVHVKGKYVDWRTPGLIPWACERASEIHAQRHDGSWQLVWSTVAGLINIINTTDTSGPAVAVKCGYKSTTGPGEADPTTGDYGEPHAYVEDDSEADV